MFITSYRPSYQYKCSMLCQANKNNAVNSNYGDMTWISLNSSHNHIWPSIASTIGLDHFFTQLRTSFDVGIPQLKRSAFKYQVDPHNKPGRQKNITTAMVLQLVAVACSWHNNKAIAQQTANSTACLWYHLSSSLLVIARGYILLFLIFGYHPRRKKWLLVPRKNPH